MRQLLFPEGSGKEREPNPLSLVFLGRIGGGLCCVLLDRGTEKRELHVLDFLFLDLLRTVACMGAQTF